MTKDEILKRLKLIMEEEESFNEEEEDAFVVIEYVFSKNQKLDKRN